MNKRRTTILLLACLGAALTLAQACGRSADFKALFDIDERAKKGAPPQSIEELEAEIARYKAEAERVALAEERVGTYYTLLVNRFVDRRMYEKAYEAAIQALRYYPANEALFYRAAFSAGYVAQAKAALGPAGAAERLRWLGVAESSYLRVLDMNPRHTPSLYGLAVLYEFELDRPEEAVPLLRRQLAIETKNVDALLLLGRTLYRTGRLEEAADVYETAARLAPPLSSRSSSGVDKRKAAEENRARILEELGAAK